MKSLSKKGVLFLTAGFHQPYIFQNVTHILEYEKDSRVLAILKTILSDGEIYISGVYYIKTLGELQKCQKMKDFDVLRIHAMYERASKPILISSLQILSQNHGGIYGRAPISIIDYLESKVIQDEGQDQGHGLIEKIDRRVSIQRSNRDLQLERDQNKDVQIDRVFPPPYEEVDIDGPIQDRQKDVEIDMPVQNQYQIEKGSELPKQKEVSFSQDAQNLNFFINPDKQPEENKRSQRIEIQEQLSNGNDPHKRIKPNEDEEEQGQMVLNNFLPSKTQPNKRPIDQSPPSSQQKNYIQEVQNKPYDPYKTSEITQRKPEISTIEIDVFDLDMMSTKKQKVTFYPQSTRKQIRKSNLKIIESILQSEEKQQNIPQTVIDYAQSNQDSITIAKSQVFNEIKSTPTKSESIFFTESVYPRQMGTTTEKKKIRQEYNLLISNLYESNQSFKIICRVNYLYEWRSKNDVPCLALDLMDSEGDEIKAIIYMNHSTKDCKQCDTMIEVGKVYCFQNGQCKRDYFEKQGLQLVFNLKAKQSWGKQIICGGKNKIIPTKIRIEPMLQHKVFSISKLIEMHDSGKSIQTNVYGILESLKISQFETKIKDPANQRQEESPEIEIVQNQLNPQQKSSLKSQAAIKALTQGYTRLYISGFLTDPLEKNKIFFTLVITKPKNELNESPKDFMQIKNHIKQGSLVVLHNVKIHANNTNTIRKLQKTKKTYMQLITNQKIAWKYNRQEFGAQIVVLPQNIDGSGLYSTFQEILSLSPLELDLVYKNPRFINYSQQPYTKRTILQMNELLEKSMLPDQCCHSEFRDAKLHAIEQKPSVEICFFCKKKVKSPEKAPEQTSVRDLIKHCGRCKKIVKVIVMHVFNMVFADNTASFPVEVLKDEYIETILGMKVEEFLVMTEKEKDEYLQLIKYTDFMMHIRSQNKVGGPIHKITKIEKFAVKSKIDEIKTERKGVQKHYTKLDSSW